MPVVTRSQSKNATAVSRVSVVVSNEMSEYEKVKDAVICEQRELYALNRMSSYSGTILGKTYSRISGPDLKMLSSTLAFQRITTKIEYLFNCKKSDWFRSISIAYNKCVEFQTQLENTSIKYNRSLLFDCLVELNKTRVILSKIFEDNSDEFDKYAKYQDRLFLERSRDSGNEDQSGNQISYGIYKMTKHINENKQTHSLRSRGK